MKTLGRNWIDPVLDPELLEASETSFKLCIGGTRRRRSCFDVGLRNSTSICLGLLATCKVLYMLFAGLLWVCGNRASCFYRGSHGRRLEQCQEENEASYVAHLRVKAGR